MLANEKPTKRTFLQTMRSSMEAALDLLYPPACCACDHHLFRQPGQRGMERWLCTVCEDQLQRIRAPYCSRCGEAYDGALEGEFRCENCADRKLAFDFAVAGWSAQGVTRDLILKFKYGRELSLRGCLGDLLLPVLEEPRLKAENLADWVLVPVPLHRLRLREREFNQSAELAAHLAKHAGLKVANALVRIRDTGHQAGLRRTERLTNLSAAFGVKPAFVKSGGRLAGRKVLLVDDVFTTGATADACARVLRQKAGVEKVVVITVARG